MRTRLVTAAVTLGLGAVLLLPALPAAARQSAPNIKALTNSINRSKNLTYQVEYTSVNSGGQTSTVTIAQSKGKSNFSTGNGSVINNGKNTYYCSSNSSGNSGSSGNTGNSGNSGNSGASTTTTTSATTCLSVKGANPLLGVESLFSPAVALGALAEARQGLASRIAGIKVTSSTQTIAGQKSTCLNVSARGKSAKYCVTGQGILSYVGSGGTHFEMTKYSSKPSASLFTLPAGATTQSIPGGGSIP